jgi:diguanylate cyclase (GGDEF)-like protein/PAS domain S-box-containing protein
MKRLLIDSPHSEQLFAEQVRLLYKNALLAYVITLVNGTILVYAQSTQIPLPTLLVWLTFLFIIATVRLLAARRFASKVIEPSQAIYWNRLYFVTTGMAGVMWGLTAVLLFPLNSLAHQVFVAFVLAGMSAGAISVLAPRLETCFVFLLPALLPLAFRFLSLDTPLQMMMGVMTLLFLLGMLVSAINFHRAIMTALSLRFDKQELEAEIAIRNVVQEELFQEKDRLQTTLGSIGEGVVLVDQTRRINYMNHAAELISGWTHREALHHDADEVFQHVDSNSNSISTALEECLQSAQQIRKQNIILYRAGKKHIVEELATPLYDRHGNAVGAVAVLRDVTEDQQKAEQLEYAADHDALTGLPNRNLLKDRIRHAIAHAQRNRENFAVLFLDLDRFKEVNDRLGHAIGDELLIEVAHRLKKCIREEDTVARLGGDEFVLLIGDAMEARQVRTVADKILHSLSKPYQLRSQRIIMTASIGCSLYPGDGLSAENLLEHADTAMYNAKKKGRNRFHMNSVELSSSSVYSL